MRDFNPTEEYSPVAMRYYVRMLLLAEHIIPVTSDPIDDGAVLVRDGRIVEIGGAQRMRSRHPKEEVRDFGRAVIMPGFVDCHTHLEYTVLRGIVHDVPYAEWLAMEHAKADMMTRDDRYDSALVGCMEMLSGGVTTVADFTSTGASCEAINDMGLRSVIYRSVGVPEKAKVDDAVKAAVKDVRAWRETSDTERIAVGIAPKALHACHPSIFSSVNALAAGMGLPVAMHMAGSYEELRYIRDGATPLSVRGISRDTDSLTDRPMWLPTGVTPVNYALNWNAFDAENTLAVHCVHVDDHDIAKLKAHDVAIAVCTRCNAQLGMGLAPLPKFLQAGIRVGLGTDSPAATDSADMFTEMRLGMLIHRSVNRNIFLSASTMLELATMGGARALRMDDEIGSLEPGKRADITAIDLSGSRQMPLVDPVAAVVTGAAVADVLFTMVGGETRYERGGVWRNRYGAIDSASVSHRVAQIRGKLRGEYVPA